MTRPRNITTLARPCEREVASGIATIAVHDKPELARYFLCVRQGQSHCVRIVGTQAFAGWVRAGVVAFTPEYTVFTVEIVCSLANCDRDTRWQYDEKLAGVSRGIATAHKPVVDARGCGRERTGNARNIGAVRSHTN